MPLGAQLDPVRPRRILFLQAPLGRPEPLVYPLGILTLAGTLPREHDICVLDPNRIGLPDTEKQAKNFDPDIICLSIRNLDSQIRRDLFYYYLHLKKFIGDLRQWHPNAVIIAGGSGFSLFPEKIMMDNSELDFGVFLEADVILPALVSTLSDPTRVRGVYYREDSLLRFTGPADLPPPESFGRPRYDLLDPSPYQPLGGVGVQTKRGCPLNCVYCTYPHLNGSRLRLLPIEQVVDELTILNGTYGVGEITFVDGVFNVPKSRTEDMLHLINRSGLKIRWRGWFTEQGFDRSFAELCRDAGCPEFSFSPDGFDDHVLILLGKSIQKKDILRIYSIAKQTPGIRVAFNFFWNPPGQSLGTWFQMMLFTIRCKLVLGRKAGGIIFGNPRIEPHTALRDMAIREGILEENDDLLPETADALADTFYSNPGTRYLDRLYAFYETLWKLKRTLTSGSSSRQPDRMN